MDNLLKIKLLTSTTVILIVLNVGLLSFMWFRPPHRFGPDDHVILHELGFNDTQRKQFDKLKQEHHKAVVSINEKDHQLHDALYGLIRQRQDSTAKADSLINEIALNKKQIETITYHHLAQVRKICAPAQQHKFDDLVINIIVHRAEALTPRP